MTIEYVTRREFERLAKVRAPLLTSLYLPTARCGEGVQEGRIRLKNLLAELRERARESGLEEDALVSTLKPLRALLEDQEFWIHQGDGLALFASPGGLEILRLPVPVEQLAILGDRLCVRPLLPAVAGDDRFYVLALSQQKIRLLECNMNDVHEVDTGDLPDSLADALGSDWEEKSLQFHTGAAGTGHGRRPALFHGQGRGHDERKDEVLRFVRLIDEGLNGHIEDRSAPLVLAAVDYLMPIFHSVSRYPTLVKSGVAGSPEHLDAETLRVRALDCVRSHLGSARDRAIRSFASVAHTERGARGLEEVLYAAWQARIESLLVSAQETAWGRFDDQTGRLEIKDRRGPSDDDLVDRAVSLAVATGATLHDVPRERMPGGVAVGAVLRH